MSFKTFRPWGLLPWVLDKVPKINWSVLGGLSTEERCLSTWQTLHGRREISDNTFLQIEDPFSRFTAITQAKIVEQRDRFFRLGGAVTNIEVHQLFGRTELLVKSVERFIVNSTGSVVLDVSSLPKRFFFPTLRLLINSPEVINLIVTYTVPQRYSSDSLAEDPESWRHIPLFAPPYPEPALKVLVIGTGFETLSLPELLEHEYHNVSVKLIFPFPPGPPSFQRTWEFVRNLEDSLPSSARQPIRVDARDVSEIFEHICTATERGARYAILAPYGPKTISIAMCLYSTLKQSAVYYTQPTVYNPEYSSGVALVNNMPETYAYCVRLDRKDFYTIN